MGFMRFVAICAACMAAAAQTDGPQLEQARLTESAQRTEFGVAGSGSAFAFSYPDQGEVVDTPAVLQFQMNRGSYPFLSTLPNQGISQLLTILKPCGVLLPHLHPRGNEIYSVISGTMNGGIAQENGAAQNITFDVPPGGVMIIPQGLLHYNANSQCEPNAFFQSYDAGDPGAINAVGALVALRGAGPDGAAAIQASGAPFLLRPAGSFDLDKRCLRRCGLPQTGAPGDGLQGLPDTVRAMIGGRR